MMGLFSFCLYKLLHKMPTPLRTPQTSGYSSFHVSNLPLWSLKPPSSRRLKLSFFICPRVSARFLHCFCTVSRDAMGTLTCKIRQRVQKLPGRKSRCFAQKRRKLKTSKIRVFCPVGSFNQRARDSSSLERTKIPRRIVRFLVGFSFYTPFARSLHGFCTVRIFRVRWSKSVNYSAIRAIFCNSGQQSQAELRFYGRVCVLQELQQSRHGDGRFCFNRGSLHRCCSLYGFHITAGDHQLISRAQAARWNR